jgi:serine/threonine protein kinase/formylglycine-generating enzyme required for sulfatase activity
MDFGSLPLTVVNAIDRACDEFEGVWRAGGQPRIEIYLDQSAEADRPTLLEALLLLEIELRARTANPARLHDYIERFPAHATVVRYVFSTLPRAKVTEPLADASRASSPAGDDLLTALPSTEQATAEASPHFHWGASSTDPATTVLATSSAQVETAEVEVTPPPESFGRYKVIRLLGEGAFGKVYLAWDDELRREVAVKVLRASVLRRPGRIESLIAEARVAAGLKHPALVTVHDVGRQGEDGAYVVLEYVEGRTLSELFRNDRPTPARLAAIMCRVADGVHHAHLAGLVHSDLKPSNILIDSKDAPHVTDFGLAVSADVQSLRLGVVAGTPAYMAPEQVRGETHRLKSGTDVWALGVVLYVGLTGRQPFSGRRPAEMFDQILNREPRPLRQIDDRIPRELERICLRCLSKRMSDRYQSAADLAEDLNQWLTAAVPQTTLSGTDARGSLYESGLSQIVPKGLHAFDVRDAHFFLALLPGPRGRDNLPESVRFWKDRIESREEGQTFPVGLLYGPSGGGKSSFIRAGLLPNLHSGIIPVYTDATLAGTEARLLADMRRKAPHIPPDCDLPGATAAIREAGAGAHGGKILLVLDQFEQWLQGHPAPQESQLVQALRQCDGRRVQALVLVRDDFWMAVTRFFRALEVPLVEGENSSAIELFDARHARNVLLEFGRSCGAIPPGKPEAGSETALFLDQAVEGLAGADERVIPVRLSLFTEVVRHRAWTPANLKALGGVAGIGVTFLEEAFDSAAAPPTYRLHRRAAQAVLQALLPAPTSLLRGKLHSESELRAAAGYTERSSDFYDLIHVLDNELRMVTPADRLEQGAGKEKEETAAGSEDGEKYYQLTHDFLVGPIRQWLDKKERSTRAGRARLRLSYVTASWLDRPGARRLPSLLEWVSIVLFTRSGTWTADQRKVMRAASRYYTVRTLAVSAMLATLTWTAWMVNEQWTATSQLQLVLKADVRNIPALLPDLDSYRSRIIGELERLETGPARPRASVILYRYKPTAQRAAFLRERLISASPEEHSLITTALEAQPGVSEFGELWKLARDENSEPGHRLRAACALAQLEPLNASWTDAGPLTARALLAEDRSSIPRWVEKLGAASRYLEPTLCGYLQDRSMAPAAAEALAVALGDRSEGKELAATAVDAHPEAFHILGRALERLDDHTESIETLVRVLDDIAVNPLDEEGKDQFARRQANAAVALGMLGHPDRIWPLLLHRDDPRLRAFLIDRLARLEVNPRPLLDRLTTRELDPIERQALLMAFAEADRERLAPAVQLELAEAARGLYSDDPHGSVHSAAALLLRHLGREDLQSACDRMAPISLDPPSDRQWFVGPNGHSFIVSGPLQGWIGSPDDEEGRDGVEENRERRHYRRIGRTLAVSATEVTFGQFQEFRRNHAQQLHFGARQDHPANSVSWYEAARYCNWLSSIAGIPKEQWCYPDPVEADVILSAAAASRSGFRLPTEAEWELLCRASTETSRPFGSSEELLPRYALTWLNSDNRTFPVGRTLPNELGLFDMLGNVFEWCHDGPDTFEKDKWPPYPLGSLEQPATDPLHEQLIVGPDVERGDIETNRLVRGSAFDYAPIKARSAYRYLARVNLAHSYLGFRIVRTIRTH